MKITRKKVFVWLACACGFILALMALAWFCAPRLLSCQTPLIPAQVILVLGGDPLYRPVQAAEVYKQGLATNVLITGFGDCNWNKRRLIDYGVPAEVIDLECESRNTRQNAEYCLRWFRARGVTNVILVTSWFHSRRALATFRAKAPGVHFSCSPSLRRLPRRLEIPLVMKEYLKVFYYSLRYGIHTFGPHNSS